MSYGVTRVIQRCEDAKDDLNLGMLILLIDNFKITFGS